MRVAAGLDQVRASSVAIVRGRGRSRSWWWVFASPMRAFRLAASLTSSTRSYDAHNNAVSSINAAVIGNGCGGISNGKITDGGSGINGKIPLKFGSKKFGIVVMIKVEEDDSSDVENLDHPWSKTVPSCIKYFPEPINEKEG